MLNDIGMFDYKVNYLNAITSLNNGTPEGHAFLEFDRINTKGEVIHIIYDVTNPETYTCDGGLSPSVTRSLASSYNDREFSITVNVYSQGQPVTN